MPKDERGGGAARQLQEVQIAPCWAWERGGGNGSREVPRVCSWCGGRMRAGGAGEGRAQWARRCSCRGTACRRRTRQGPASESRGERTVIFLVCGRLAIVPHTVPSPFSSALLTEVNPGWYFASNDWRTREFCGLTSRSASVTGSRDTKTTQRHIMAGQRTAEDGPSEPPGPGPPARLSFPLLEAPLLPAGRPSHRIRRSQECLANNPPRQEEKTPPGRYVFSYH